MRWIVRIVGVIVLLAVLAVGALFLLPSERIAGIAADRFTAATGRALTIEGPVRPTLWPSLGVSTGPVTIANADWSEAGPMLTAQGLDIAVNLPALIGGDIRVTKIAADTPNVLLEVSSDGQANWDFSGGAPATEEAAASEDGVTAFAIDEATLTDGRVTFTDHTSGTRYGAEAINATLTLPDFAGPAHAEIAAQVNGQPVTLTTTIAGLEAFLRLGAVPVVVQANIGGAAVGFDGNAGLTPLAAGGALTADVSNWAGLFAVLDAPAPAIPRGLGQQSLSFSGDVTANASGKVTLRGGMLQLDQNALSLAADLDASGAKPALTAQLSAGALDLSGLSPESGEAVAEEAPSATGWSTDPIDVSALQALDATVSVTAESINLGVSQLGRTHLLTTLTDGRAVTEIKEMQAYDGGISGSVVVNSRGGLSMRANLAGSSVALEPLLSQLAGFDRLAADGDVRINILGVGNSLDALMQSWEGDGSVQLGQGALQGFDLVGMLRNLDTSFVGDGYQTIFESITATFDVVGGQVTNPDLSFLSPLLKASGEGRIGLGTQDIEYQLLPVLLEGAVGEGIRVPLTIKGPWNDLSFALDVEALVKQEFSEEIDAAKERVTEEVKDKVAEELGIDPSTVEGAAEGILNLLGNN